MSAITTEQYLYKKEIDWSTLQWGFTLPADIGIVFSAYEERFLERGESKPINILLNGQTYKARVTNENFDKKYHEIHKGDIVRILYSGKALSQALMTIFSESTAYLSAIRQAADHKRYQRDYLPENKKEYLVIYATELEDTYVFEPLLCSELVEAETEFKAFTETEAESELARLDATDNTAGVTVKEGIRKIRKLDRKIGESLKLHYSYRCQICGALVGEGYDTHIAEAHHIDYFTKSLNNDAGNILIVCPNHHRVIHDRDPIFNRNDCTYLYPNGLRESLKYNDHIH